MSIKIICDCGDTICKKDMWRHKKSIKHQSFLKSTKSKICIHHKNLGDLFMEIDEEDYDKIKNLNITINHQSNPHTKYAKAVINENRKYVKTLHIHRVIMGLGDFKNDNRIINHIDGNGLNNKKSNLEICTALYNSQSINKPNCNVGCINFEKNTEKTKRLKQWRFMITINKKRHTKRFLTEKEAIEYKNQFVKDLINNA